MVIVVRKDFCRYKIFGLTPLEFIIYRFKNSKVFFMANKKRDIDFVYSKIKDPVFIKSIRDINDDVLVFFGNTFYDIRFLDFIKGFNHSSNSMVFFIGDNYGVPFKRSCAILIPKDYLSAGRGNREKVFVSGISARLKGKRDISKLRRLLELQIVKRTDGYISRYINRKLSLKVTSILNRFSFLTPNVMTVISTLIGFLSAYFFFIQNYIIGGVLAQVSSILDGCDGEIARFKNLSTPFGRVLDMTLDRYVDIAFFFSIFYNLDKNIYTFLAFTFALTGTIMVSYVSHATSVRPKFVTRDVRIFLIFLFSIASVWEPKALYILMIVLASLSHLGVIYSLVVFTKMGRE